ncbi:MAG: DNA mismatch repair protein MutL, partial [Dokdonia sp.]
YTKQPVEGWEQMYEGLKTSPSGGGSQVTYESEEVTGDLFQKDAEYAFAKAESSTYQLNKKYIISTIKSGMVIIDQHRAHQRILYEELLRNITVKESVSQQLLFPLVLNYSSSELGLLIQLKEGLENTGFVFGKVADETLEITGIPTSLPESEVPIVIEQLLSDLENEVPDTGFSQTDTLAKSMAKSMAVKAGEALDAVSREHLVNSLFACKEPSVSPNNRTTFITMGAEELDRKFK